MNRRIRDRLLALAGAERDARLRADAGQRHLRHRGHDRHAAAARRQAAGAGQRRLRQADAAHRRGDGPRGDGRSRWPEDVPVDRRRSTQALAARPGASPTSPSSTARPRRASSTRCEAVAEVCAAHGRALIDRRDERLRRAAARRADGCRFEAVVASSNKCLEGVPGMGFVIVRREALERAQGNAALAEPRPGGPVARAGEQRPVAVHAADPRAGRPRPGARRARGRGRRRRPRRPLPAQPRGPGRRHGGDGLRDAGAARRCRRRSSSPSACRPTRPSSSRRFYDGLREKGFVIYPGKLTIADSFRIGCIGRLGEAEMRGALAAVRETMAEMGVASGAPAPLAAGGGAVSFAYRRSYRGRLRAAVLDWAGTVVDHGCMAPAATFIEAFAGYGVPVTRGAGARADGHGQARPHQGDHRASRGGGGLARAARLAAGRGRDRRDLRPVPAAAGGGGGAALRR